MSDEEVKQDLEIDRRFSLNQMEEGLFVGRANITLVDSRLLQAVERWKDQMSIYFRQNHCDVKLCMLSQLVKRPVDVPKHIKLVDVLNSDLQRRFLILSAPVNGGGGNSSNKKRVEDAIVKYKCTPAEVEEYHEQWRQNVVAFLLQQPHPVPLVTIGTHVIKPKNLGKNQKLIEVVKLDPLKRFDIHIDPSHNSLTRLSIHEEYGCEIWRQQIHRILLASSSNLLMDLDVTGAPRPVCLPNSVTLRSAIVNDPKQRFRYAADYPQLRRMTRPSAAGPASHVAPRLSFRSKFPQDPNQSRTFQAHNPSSSPLHTPLSLSSQQFNQHNSNSFRPHAHQRIPVLPPHAQASSGHVHGVEQNFTSSNQRNFNGSYQQLNSRQFNSVPPGFVRTVPSSPFDMAPQSGTTLQLPVAQPDAQPDKRLKCHNTDTFGQQPLGTSDSSDFNEYCAPPNLFGFLNDPSSTISPSFKGDVSGSSPIPAALILEKTVSSEFHEYTSIPGLLRFLSDTF